MSHLQFTLEDFRTPERLERLFRRLNQTLAEPPAAPAAPNLNALAGSLAPLIRSQLQAPGIAPLNLQSLLPSTGLGVVLEDTHANRLTLYPASATAIGALFWETDRTVLYVVTESAGVRAWTYAAGMYQAAFANRPADLGANDAGFLYMPSVYIHICRWSGSGWAITDGGGGWIADCVVNPGAGWQVCDGTATTYLALSGADLAETAFTTPDEVTAPSGVYHKSIAAYTGVINAATAGSTSGSTGSTTATNIAASTGVTIADHPSHTHDDASALATPDLFAPDTTAAGTAAQTGGPSATLTHPVTDPTHNHTQNAHTHGIGSIVVDATGQPRNLGCLRYFRR